MSESALVYRIPGAVWTLELPADAVRVLQSHTQHRWRSSEAAGQLFSTAPGQSNVRVDAVTKLPTKAASRTGLRLDIPAVITERQQLFAQGLHCLGLWHSHPQSRPSPSPDDTRLAEEHARAGWAAYAGLVFIIVGTAPAPDGIGVWVHDGTTLWCANHEEPKAVDIAPTPLLK